MLKYLCNVCVFISIMVVVKIVCVCTNAYVCVQVCMHVW